MVKKLFTLLLGVLVGYACHAQRDIEPLLIFNDTSNFNFTGEWQYLSTDIFLFNGDKFSNLINELDFGNTGPKRNKRKKSNPEQELLEYLFITASLKNVKFFGDNDITYPLYNFQISKDRENKYQTFVSDNIDYVRIIDNLPLYSAKDYIDAEIQVKAITNNNRDQVLSMVATQLKNLSKILTPTDAVMSIIGEFGNFLESNTKKKEYRFSSTIRLFEQKNFDNRIHSIKVYALTTANSLPVKLGALPLKNFLDTVNYATVNRNTLKNLVDHGNYPVIVVVNYKSLYRMDPISGDEVSFANIEKRKLKVENDYRQGLINAETYRQEKDFTSFLTVFASFKNFLDVYNLNYKTGNTDAISGSLFRVMQHYRELLKTFDAIKFKYRGNGTFMSVFNHEYESILGFASLYLDNDYNLKSTKELVNTLTQLENSPNVPNAELEQHIATLHFSGIFKPELMAQNLEGQLINSQLTKLEDILYRKTFELEIQKLDSTPASGQTRNAPSTLLGLIKNTSCGICREKSIAAINTFGQRMEEHNRKVELMRKDSLVSVLEPWVFRRLELLQLIKKNWGEHYPSSTESSGYLGIKIAETERDINNIKDFIKIDVSTKDLSTILNLNQKLLGYQKNVDESFRLICGLKPELCSTASAKTPKDGDECNITPAEADSVVQQANIFIAIFDYQANLLTSKIDSSAFNGQTALPGNIRGKIDRLKTAVNLMETVDLTAPACQKLEEEINQLIRGISDNLNNRH